MIINKNLFKYTNLHDVEIPKSFETLLYHINTYHYIRYGVNVEGIMLKWKGDVFNLNDTLYIRKLK